jgi:hypothetical protein
MRRTPLLLLLAALLFSGCAQLAPHSADGTVYVGGFHSRHTRPPRAPVGRVDRISYWHGDGVSGKPSIHISLRSQRAYFYKGGRLVGVSVISSGREGFNTQTGNFKVIQKSKDHVSSRFGDYVDRNGRIIQKEIDTLKDPKPPGAIYDGARMPFFIRFVGGTGLHEGFLPGYPASHGCIRMPGFMAATFFQNVELGTPVTVVN